MTREEAKHIVDIAFGVAQAVRRVGEERTYHEDEIREAKNMAMEALGQETCEMSVEEYRLRMIQAFHNSDCDELIAVCVMPTEKEFEHLEWILKNHYKKEPCEDAINRQAVLEIQAKYAEHMAATKFWQMRDDIKALPPVPPQHTDAEIQKMQEMEQSEIQKAYELGKASQQKTGHWINEILPLPLSDSSKECVKCSKCGLHYDNPSYYCPNCGDEKSRK